MPAVTFSHSYIGTLTVDNGVDAAQWAYGLNTQTYPTFGGEVVQILSVYIDDLTLQGTCSTYEQLELIYKYFAKYLIAATQGNSSTPTANESYNMEPMVFSYPSRNWKFFIYPMTAPGFGYQTGMVGPQWQLQAHVIDDSPDISVIKDGIKAATVKKINVNGEALTTGTYTQTNAFSLTGNISPNYGNPNNDPFQTADPSVQAETAQASQWADYYNSLIPAYMKGDFASLTGVTGSQPNYGATKSSPQQASLTTKTAPKSSTTKK